MIPGLGFLIRALLEVPTLGRKFRQALFSLNQPCFFAYLLIQNSRTILTFTQIMSDGTRQAEQGQSFISRY